MVRRKHLYTIKDWEKRIKDMLKERDAIVNELTHLRSDIVTAKGKKKENIKSRIQVLSLERYQYTKRINAARLNEAYAKKREILEKYGDIEIPYNPPTRDLSGETPRSVQYISDDGDDSDDEDYSEGEKTSVEKSSDEKTPNVENTAAAAASSTIALQNDYDNYWNLPCAKKRSYGYYMPEVDCMGMPKTEVTYNKNGEKEISLVGGSIHRNDAANSIRFEITVKAIPSQPLLVNRPEDLLTAVSEIYERACSAIEETAVVKDILALDGVDPSVAPYAPMTPGYGAAAYAPFTPSVNNCPPPFTPGPSSSNEK